MKKTFGSRAKRSANASPPRKRRAPTSKSAGIEERLREAEETLNAIRSGEVDALVVQGPAGDQVFTLKGADHRYRQLVETMNEGALMLAPDGTIVYANSRFANLVRMPHERLLGSMLTSYVAPSSHAMLEALLREAASVATGQRGYQIHRRHR